MLHNIFRFHLGDFSLKEKQTARKVVLRFLKIHDASPVHKSFQEKQTSVQAIIQNRQDKATGVDRHHIGSDGESNTKPPGFSPLGNRSIFI